MIAAANILMLILWIILTLVADSIWFQKNVPNYQDYAPKYGLDEGYSGEDD